MTIGEAAAIDVATLLLHTGRDYSTAEVSSGPKITEAEALRASRHGLRAAPGGRVRSISYASSTARAGSMTMTNSAPSAAT